MPGTCAMRGSCGTVRLMGQQLPCPYDGEAIEPETDDFRNQITSVCGTDYAAGPVCCTSDQVSTLQANLQQAEALISSCPACRNNFRDFFCSFTCSPDQGSFLRVSSTQETREGNISVKSVEYFVGDDYGDGFYKSCNDIKFGPTNGYAMDLLGGGAKNYRQFFEYMGALRPGLGSPFQINFPQPSDNKSIIPFNPAPRSCADPELSSRCTCIDCPDICSILPSIPAPGQEPTCQVGLMSCLTFIMIIVYVLALVGFAGGYSIIAQSRKRSNLGRLALLSSTNGPSTPSSGQLIGASSLGMYHDDAASDTRQSLGRGASLLDPDGLQQRQYRLNFILRRIFYRLGYFCASNPFITLFFASTFIGVANIGWKDIAVEKDPVRLWVAPTSETNAQKIFFDDHFGPFYRAEQVFVTAYDKQQVLSYYTLKWWFSVEQEILQLRSADEEVGFKDICFKPSGPDGACAVQSVSGWFESGDITPYNETTWQTRVSGCAKQPVACIPDFGQPLEPESVLGGIPKDPESGALRIFDAKALVISYVVNNPADPALVAKAEKWEVSLRSYLEGLSRRAPQGHGLQIAFSTGVSLEEELNKSTNTDVKTVVLSYLFMFLYVSFTLGCSDVDERSGIITFILSWFKSKRSVSTLSSASSGTSTRSSARNLLRRFFVQSKVVLGFFALVLVLTSITSSIGIFSFAGVRMTLIIAEVIPFLVLAVGVDNVFLLVAELDKQNASHGPNASLLPPSVSLGLATPMSPPQRQRLMYDDPPYEDTHSSRTQGSAPAYVSPEERVARTLAKMGPSLLMSTGTQTVAFALGALVPMPAVRNFALYAALSVFVNATLQVTVFISALTLDLRRTESSRVDCFPFVKIPPRITLQDALVTPGGFLSRFFRRVYAPFLLQSTVKGSVIAIFAGIVAASVISTQHITLGLDQRLALPSESYLIQYFDAVEDFLEFGPPVYFVLDGANFTNRSVQQSVCSRFTTCDPLSIGNTLEAERKRSESSFLAQPPAVWLDEFLRWLDPVIDSCCRVRKRDPSTFCESTDSDRLCKPCFADHDPSWNITMDGLPQGDEFTRYLTRWLQSPTDDKCPLGGKQAYRPALSIDSETGDVLASHFRTYHTPLRKQSDYINAYLAAHRVADDISGRIGQRVFPYSVFYVFFEQYAHIVGTTQEIIGLGLAAVLLMTSLFLGSLRAGTIVTATVGLTVLSIMGVMGAWNINLNALSLVNLVISLGIAVEFCSHITRGYMNSSAGSGLYVDGSTGQKERDDRIFSTLVDVGPSVLSGITFTKLIGISVLGFTRSRLLEIYYFRMWLSLIILGALHGLVLLPVLLSLAGGPGYSIDEEEDEEWMSSAIRRHDYEYTPFLDSDSAISE